MTEIIYKEQLPPHNTVVMISDKGEGQVVDTLPQEVLSTTLKKVLTRRSWMAHR
jgi:hypothetical protein